MSGRLAYTVRRADKTPDVAGGWQDPIWSRAGTITVDCFHVKTGTHRPQTRVRLLHTDRCLYVQFQVSDCFVRSVCTRPHEKVSDDSCVEFFFQPKVGGGYFNLEANAGGTFLCAYITPDSGCSGDWQRQYVDPEWFERFRVYHSLPSVVEPELAGPLEWTLGYGLPMEWVEEYAGAVGALSGQVWRGNFYKCGGKTSHPHWAAWSSIGEVLSFHQPGYFGELHFE